MMSLQLSTQSCAAFDSVCPQACVVLFYTADVSSIAQGQRVAVHSYADDTQLGLEAVSRRIFGTSRSRLGHESLEKIERLGLDSVLRVQRLGLVSVLTLEDITSRSRVS